MDIQIISEPFELTLHGYSGIATTKDYVGTAFQLMDRMWKEVRSRELKNKGRNVWVFEPGDSVFAGIELESPVFEGTNLERRKMHLEKYAYFKHIGPYNLIRETGQRIRRQLFDAGFSPSHPYLEIYGHMGPDESKLETELIVALG